MSIDNLGNCKRKDVFSHTFDKNLPKGNFHRGNKILKETCERASVTLPIDKVTNYARSAGMNRT